MTTRVSTSLLAVLCAGMLTACMAQLAEPGGACGSNGLSCPNGQCCSQFGFCGVTDGHCGAGCQSSFGACGAPGSSTPGPAPGPAPVPGPSSGGDGIMVSFDQFQAAVTSGGYPAPSRAQYDAFAAGAVSQGGIRSRQELAMFLAQIMWESGGLQYKEEISPPAGAYDSNAGGVRFYGRGYIQLTWSYNYRAASEALFGDLRLVDDPTLVSRDESVAWGVSFWYWRANVGTVAGVQAGRFGASTRAINGALECDGPNQDKARKRFELYVKVAGAFGVQESPQEGGCYN